jgi:hypothetical protein
MNREEELRRVYAVFNRNFYVKLERLDREKF